ncbi:MAG TPA: hypothetical protein VJS38_11005 [Phenylobacterium sp.]|uniref:hypothetical protein n=1 Tax=Phenylobacterium sp. TaxID=1871053 RepID=UPI002B462437|nr:hypothetical protein [Phenylobacterium sp.]HKR88690.1 hypothetical protein [Phenylobacterium sp.]
MPHPGEHVIGGGTNAPPLGETVADEAMGPKDRTNPELAELADSPEGRRIEQKLRAEALARRRGEDEDADIEDPTGHA